MRYVNSFLATGLAVLATPAAAQSLLTPPNTIVIAASATVETPPDTVTLNVTIRGDGKVPDDATRALAAKIKAVTGGLRSIDPALDIRTGEVAITEVHAGECKRDSGMPLSAETMLSSAADAVAAEADSLADQAVTGSDTMQLNAVANPCAVIGYTARSDATVMLRKVADAGTAVGLASRLGASSAGLESFDLAKDDDARARATAAAIANARSQAQAIAAGSGLKLGQIVSVVDGLGIGEDLTQRAPAVMEYKMVAPSPPPPVPVDISPRPVTTSARLVVTFSLLR